MVQYAKDTCMPQWKEKLEEVAHAGKTAKALQTGSKRPSTAAKPALNGTASHSPGLTRLLWN